MQFKSYAAISTEVAESLRSLDPNVSEQDKEQLLATLGSLVDIRGPEIHEHPDPLASVYFE